MNLNEYLFIDTKITESGDVLSEIQSCSNYNNSKLTIKQYYGINTDNFIISKDDGRNLKFGIFSINGIYYINLNGEHIIDYYKFIQIKKVSYNENDNILKISNKYLDDIHVHNCDLDIFRKALSEMNTWMKNKKSVISNILYYILN